MNIFDVDSLRFVEVFSSEIDDQFKKDFIKVCREVFGKNAINEFLFNRKYIENIYGDSILVVVYSNGIPIAARAFWRNDIDGKRAYQPGDTCVTQQFRRRGIFAKMTNIALEMVKKEDIIYNFPNQNSYPQYIKLGWKNLMSYRPIVMTSIKKYNKEHPYIISNEYLKWWFIPKKYKFFICERRNNTFLVTKGKFNRYHVVGKINLDMRHYFEKINAIFPILIYLGAGQKFYNKKYTPINIVIKITNEEDDIIIPTFKMDAI